MSVRAFALFSALFSALLVLAPAASANEIPFGPQQIVSTSEGIALEVIAGDLDGDGDMDLVGSGGTNGPDGVYWYENLDGAGSFSSARLIDGSSGALPNRTSIELADMDGDGDLDLLTGWYYLAAWYPNDGAGNFGARTVIRDETFNGAGYDDFKAADLDGDGDLDVIGLSGTSLGPGDKLVWFRNNGGGGFNPASENFIDALQNENGGGKVEAADLDGDGDLDIVANQQDAGDSRVVWYRNTDGAGTFSAKLTLSPVPFNVGEVKVVDIDGDGDFDVVSVDASFNAARWHENSNPSGDASTWVDHDISTSNSVSFHVEIADMDLDGDPDLLLGTGSSSEARWIENSSGDGSTWINRSITGGLNNPRATIAVDIDGDGDLDVATASLLDNKFAWVENRTIHRNSPFEMAQVAENFLNDVRGVRLADLDGDGDLDAVTGETQDSEITWLENNGGLSFFWPVRIVSVPGTLPYDVAVADIDGDGDLDIASSARTNAIDWLLNDGATPPGFTVQTVTTTIPSGIQNDIATGDIDGDGDIDLISFARDLAWYENDGATMPGWTERVFDTFVGNTRTVDVADLDGDGDLDVFIGMASDSPDVIWYENDGAAVPGFTKRPVDTADGVLWVGAADLDGDGDMDLAATSANTSKILWYESDGGSPPSFARADAADSDVPRSAVMADFDQDGDIDFASAPAGIGAQWHENNGAADPQWTKETLWAGVPNSILGFGAGDLDGDGDLDLIAAGTFADTIWTLQNRGGQFGIVGADSSDGTAPEGEETSFLAATVAVNGRPGDSVGRVSTLGLRFTDSGATPLSSGQANALIENLNIYRDDGSGSFESGTDVLLQTLTNLTLSAGVQSVGLPASDPNVLVAAPATFFVVGELTANASAQSPNQFRVTQLSPTGGNSIAVDASAGIVLLPEFTTDFQSQIISAAGRFVVNSTVDAIDATPGDGFCDDGTGNCTLRAAVMEANSLAGDNRIVLGPGTYTLTIPGNTDDAALTGDLDLTESFSTVTIVGAGAGITIVDGGGLDRVFHVGTRQATVFEDISITGGANANSGTLNWGGGIYFDLSGVGVVRRCELYGNTAVSGGGAIGNTGTSIIGAQIDIVDSAIYNNTSPIGSTAIENNGWEMVLTNVTVSGHNTGSTSSVIVNQSQAESIIRFVNSTVVDNSAEVRNQSAAGTIFMQNSIFDGTTAPDITGSNFESLGHNLLGRYVAASVTSATFLPSDQLGTTGSEIDSKTVVLGDNGGPTLTHALQPDSPAIDAGSCPSSTKDQRGLSRPYDLAAAANVDDGCDIGALESRVGPMQDLLEVPVRWCGVRGAPSIEDPSLVGETNINDVLRKRHERASDNVYVPSANIAFRSAGNEAAESYPLLEDPDCTETSPGVFSCGVGVRGDVFVDLDEANFDEFQFLVTACRRAWEAQDPDIQGVTAVHINRFVDATGAPLEILGVGGRAGLSDDTEQAMGGRVMVVDNVYRLDVPANPDVPNPPDAIDRLLAHELGHSLSLQHGDGVDNDNDGDLDNDDDKAANLPRFDGKNLMQYRNGTDLTAAQVERARDHADDSVPDIDVQPVSDAVSNDGDISPENKRILQFGYDGLTELENARILQFDNASVLQFENKRLLQFENKRILQFENKRLLQFENKRILQFGMDYDGTLASNKTRVSGTMGSLPWPAAIRPTTRYFFYMDLDRNDATGGYPPLYANPELPGSNFPGQNNRTDQPNVAEEAGIDLIAQVELTSSCPGEICGSSAVLKVFDFNDGTLQYDLVLTDPNPNLTAMGVELYIDNGGQAPADDNIPTNLLVQPEIDNSILFAAGWGFTTPGGGGAPVPKPVRMEVLTTVDCVGTVLNDDAASTAVDCQCTDCNDCPDYPGCVDVFGTPDTLTGTTLVTDSKLGELTFEPPVLPTCVSIPQTVGEGASLSIYVKNLPLDVTGTLEVEARGFFVGSAPFSPADGGTKEVAITLPTGLTGPVRLSSGLVGLAPRADCIANVSPTTECADNDGDGLCDAADPDDDNDGVADGSDPAPFNPLVCGDSDGDTCDDCSSGTFNTAADGPDYDLDGLCDAGDPDDDNDGIPDVSDGEPRNENACGDSDLDRCDDCVINAFATPLDDGPDVDGDGLCDFGDIDDDNDGTADYADCAPLDSTLRRAPGAVSGVAFLTNKERISWDAGQFGTATTSDLIRGTLLPVGGAGTTCLEQVTSAEFHDDAAVPAAGGLFWYLVRADNACGGTVEYGKASDETPRVTGECD